MSNTLILADLLEAAGLGGTEPVRAAAALLAALRLQAGSDEPDHHVAHNAMIVRALRGMPLESARAMFADAPPDAAMMVLTRLVAAGVSSFEIREYLPRIEQQREAA